MSRRVVITGVGLASPIGHSLSEVSESLRTDRHGISVMSEWARIGNLATRVAGRVVEGDVPELPRAKARTMGRVARLSVLASDRAVDDSGIDRAALGNGLVGLAYGSTHGSSSELEAYCRTLFANDSLRGIASSAYLKFMSHTCAANLAMYYGIRGRVISTCAACVSGSQAVGVGYEAVRSGQQEVMVCGGAEELHFSHAGVFDILYATSTKFNDRPEATPRPFDGARDGLVVAEGAGTVVVESLEHARARGAHIYAEIIGYGTNCDGAHLTNPSADGMAASMRLALSDANISSDRIDYVNAHGTATEVGDIAESHATLQVLGDRIPISSTKSFTGHTLGACGAIEVAFCLAMMRDRFLPPTRNLTEVDSRCAALNYIMGEARVASPKTIMTNNFAFGGINTSLILREV